MLKFRKFLLCTALVLSLVLTGTGTVVSFEVVPEDGNAHFLLIDDEHTQIFSIDALDIEGAVKDSFGPVSRLRPVTLSDWVGESESVAVGDELVLNLFSDASYVATIDRISTDVNDILCVRGRLQGDRWGYVIILYCDQGGAYASIEVLEEGRHYILFKGEGELYYVAELDPDKMDVRTEAPLLVSSPSQKEESEIAALPEYMVTSTLGLGPDDPATIDVMIVYTPAAEEFAEWGPRPGINVYIALAMANAQLVMDNSNTGVTLELVHSARVEYTEHGNSQVDLDRLRYTDGKMDEVHQWRDMYGADLVQLFCVVNDVAGRGYILDSKYGQPDWAFSLVDIEYVDSIIAPGVPIHEMGHNLGCHHHEDDQFNGQPAGGPTDWVDWPENTWSAGYRFSYAGLPHCTVMAYTDDYRIRVPFFSNPDVKYYGVPLIGVPTGDRDDNPETQDHDNARTIREIKHVVAAYEEAFEDFEWGDDGDSLDTSGGDVKWTVVKKQWFGSPVAEIDTDPDRVHTGTRSARFDRVPLSYMQASYSEDPPTYRGFYFYFEEGSDAVLYTTNGDEDHRIYVRVSLDGDDLLVEYYNGETWVPHTVEYTDEWHRLAFKNIDWEDDTYDIKFDGTTYVYGADMVETSGEYNGVTAYYNAGGFWSEFWIDDILK